MYEIRILSGVDAEREMSGCLRGANCTAREPRGGDVGVTESFLRFAGIGFV